MNVRPQVMILGAAIVVVVAVTVFESGSIISALGGLHH